MPDDITDPFEEFKKEKEQKKEAENQVRNQEDQPDNSSSSGSNNFLKMLKDHSQEEDTPSGFWSHRFKTGELDEDGIRELSEERPGGFASHRLTSEEQEKMNREAREEADPPEGFESHRLDHNVDEDQPSGKDDDTPNKDPS